MPEKLIEVLTRGLAVWFVIIFVESLHGIARSLALEPLIGDLRARQVSVFIGAALIVAISFVFVRWLKASLRLDFILVGAMWVVLTVGFEILLGRFVMGVSWERIASDYNLVNGGLMPLGLLVMLFAPLAMAIIQDEV
ncbi:MAG: hypothetical protein WBD27_18050 [Pyrinomonadaceae bacterium]